MIVSLVFCSRGALKNGSEGCGTLVMVAPSVCRRLGGGRRTSAAELEGSLGE